MEALCLRREIVRGHTYSVVMNVILSIERLLSHSRKKTEAMGRSLNQLVRNCLTAFVGADDPERNIEEFKRLSGKGRSRGWRFNRDEIHERS